MSKLILPRGSYFVCWFVLLCIFGIECIIGYNVGANIIVYEGPCTPVFLEKQDAYNKVVLKITYEGKSNDIDDPDTILAFVKDPSTPIFVKVDKNGKVTVQKKKE